MKDNRVDLETPAISVLAAASKTPFRTALFVTLGIGLGRFILFALSILTLFAIYKMW
jgi:threonine/homoserine/homoserine lactone efflux protein